MSVGPERVLHVISKMDRGGAESLLMGTYRNVDRERVQFDFAVDDAEADFSPEILELGGRIFPLSRPSADLRGYLRSLKATIDQHGPYRCVHSHVHHFSGVVLAAAARRCVPVRIAQSHTTSDGRPDTLRRHAYRAAMRALISRYATHRLACSEGTARALFGPRASDWVLVPNGIEVGAAEAGLLSRDPARTRLGLPSNAMVVVHVGAFRPEKNHGFLVEAFARLAEIDPTARLVLAGDGELRPRVEADVRARGLSERVDFLGTRADVWLILSAASVAAYPSLYEGVSVAMIEMQAAGVPIVASRSFERAVDLGLGLVRWEDLGDAGRWAAALSASARMDIPPWPARKGRIAERGYDLAVTASALQEIYLG